MTLTRREVLQRASFVLGYAVTGSAAAAALSGCDVDLAPAWTPRLFSAQQALTVRAMADHLLPATTTPGAADLQVERYIDAALDGFASADERQAFLEGLDEFSATCESMFERSFVGLSPEERDQIFTHYETQSPAIPPNVWGGQITETVDAPVFYRQFKQLALVGYFASETVGETLLAYDPIPGEYNSCMPLADVGKAWSL